MLAETTITPPTGFAVWLACAGFAMLILNQGFKLVRNFKGNQPHQIEQPVEVRASAEYVHKREFDQHMQANQQEHQNMFAKLGGVERGLAKSIKEDTAELHEKINDVAQQNAAQEAKQDLMNQRLVQMDGKIDRLIERKA